jgi:O-antigen ligase
MFKMKVEKHGGEVKVTKTLEVTQWIEQALPRAKKGGLDLAVLARRMALFTLSLAIMTASFRYRWLLFSQETTRVWGDYTNGLFFVHDAFLILTLVIWGISLWLQPRRIGFGPLLLTVPLAGLSLTALMSTVFSLDIRLSTYHLVRLFLAAGLYLFLINEVRDLRTIIGGVAAGLFIQASVGVAQWSLQHDLGLQWLGEYELDPAWRGVSIVWAEGIRSLRAYGLSDHPNLLGGVLAFSLILLVSWWLGSTIRSGVITSGLFVLGNVALLLTFSRSAWAAMVAGSVLMAGLLYLTRQKDTLKRGVELILAVVIVAAPFVWANSAYLGVRLNSGGSFDDVSFETRSLSERAILNVYANQIFAANAVTGVGYGTFPLALRYLEPELTFNYQPPHLVMLEAAAETGLFGALFYVLATLGPWLVMWFQRKRLTFSPAFIGACALLLAVTVVSFFDYYPWLLASGRLWQWLAWGLWASFFQMSLDRK